MELFLQERKAYMKYISHVSMYRCRDAPTSHSIARVRQPTESGLSSGVSNASGDAFSGERSSVVFVTSPSFLTLFRFLVPALSLFFSRFLLHLDPGVILARINMQDDDTAAATGAGGAGGVGGEVASTQTAFNQVGLIRGRRDGWGGGRTRRNRMVGERRENGGMALTVASPEEVIA